MKTRRMKDVMTSALHEQSIVPPKRLVIYGLSIMCLMLLLGLLLFVFQENNTFDSVFQLDHEDTSISIYVKQNTMPIYIPGINNEPFLEYTFSNIRDFSVWESQILKDVPNQGEAVSQSKALIKRCTRKLFPQLLKNKTIVLLIIEDDPLSNYMIDYNNPFDVNNHQLTLNLVSYHHLIKEDCNHQSFIWVVLPRNIDAADGSFVVNHIQYSEIPKN